MSDPQQQLTERLAAAVEAALGPDFAGADPMVRTAQKPEHGDYQANLAMALAKRLGRKPRDVAQAIVNHLDASDLCKVPEIAGPGFINLTLRDDYVESIGSALAADDRLGVESVHNPQTVVIDYSSPNVAKEMHVGHLRSTVIGDALARALDFLGHTVVRQNHIGDWGTQFGMLVQYLIENVEPGVENPWRPDGEYDVGGIGDLDGFYKAAKKVFDEDAEFADRARQRVVKLQGGDEETLARWRYLVRQSKRHFDDAYRRMGIETTDTGDAHEAAEQHLLEYRAESFYNPALGETVRELEDRGMVTESEGAACIFLDEFTGKDGEPLPLIIRKSGGGYLYATTDLAALRYRVREIGADRIIYVTDARQRQHFAMVFRAAEKAGWLEGQGGAVDAEHVSFGTILGEDGKPFKTRSGETVRLADLLDEAERRAADIVAEKNPELSEKDRAEVAAAVGIGAIKYGDLSSDRVKDYVFSWQRMLAMDGNTAPYLQYAYTRVRSIFRKAGEEPPRGAAVAIEHPAERALVLKLAQLGPTVRAVGESLEPHRLCTWLFELASAFSAFYENCPVLQADEKQRASRLALCDTTARALQLGLGLLGIRVMDRM